MKSIARNTTKSTKTTTAKPTLAAVPTGPLTPPPFVLDPIKLTGTCDTGDVLENVLDELRAVLGALVTLDDESELHDLISLAHRKAEAAAELYDNLDAWKAAH